MTSNSGGELPEGEARGFNPVFLVYFLVCSGLSVFYLLYFNRVFAWVVAQGIRTWTWHKYRVDITFQALQISILGGRVFFTGLRYNGQNETFHIQSGHATWRYWKRRVQHVDIGQKRPNSQESAERNATRAGSTEETLPCRINASLIGLEWFVYNRSPAYNSVLDGLLGMSRDASSSSSKAQSQNEKGREAGDNAGNEANVASNGKSPRLETDSTPLNAIQRQREKQGQGDERPSLPSSGSNSSNTEDEGPNSLPLMLQFFPISVECQKAALVMGNENTKALLVVKTEHVSGLIDASETRAPDPYRQLFKAQFRHPVVEFRENEDYREDQENRVTKEKTALPSPTPARKRSWIRRQRKRIFSRLRTLVPYWNKSVDSLSTRSAGTGTSQNGNGGGHWQGLSRYLHDGQGDKAKWASVEYAAIHTIVDSPGASMTMYWDAGAKVVRPPSHQSGDKDKWSKNINGGSPPAWGITLTIHGGTVNYGPWADRQRAELQRFFFPSLCKDAVPAKPLAPGAWRVATQFTLYVELDEEVVVRIPIREDSKNWKFKGKEPPTQRKHARHHEKRKQRGRPKKPSTGDATQFRPAGWLDLKVGANATVSFSMDMVAGSTGYSMAVDVDLPNTELSSSVNHEILWRSSSQRISCDLSTPLKWNGLRDWYFDVQSDNLELFILRDHVFLLIDLIDDWASGPPPDYLAFTPFKYFVNMGFSNLKLYLNANDANIINNPTSLDDNTYVIASVPSLNASVCIPIDKFRPDRNSVPFDVRAETLDVSLHLPPWNTQATFVSSKTIGLAQRLQLGGQYQYNTTSSAANTDTLTMDITGHSPVITLYGFIIRYILNLKDNYFGEHIHFKTLEEHQSSLRQPQSGAGVVAPASKPYQPSNDVDVILNIRVDGPRVLLPANVYSPAKHIVGETATIGIDLRLTNYYMDLDITVSPINLSLGSGEQLAETPGPGSATHTQLFVDGLTVYGHRLLGLPPTEPTYLCNWDLKVGAVTGECTAEFLTALARGGRAFIFNFDDEENALIPYSSIIVYDITFLRVMVQSVRVWLHVDEAAFLLSSSTIDVYFNDWARSHYSKRANLRIPNLQLSCINSEAASKQRTRYHFDVDTDALFQTSVHVGIIGRKYNFTEERRLQQELVRREDQRTHRAQFLILSGLTEDFIAEPVDPPAQCFPMAPAPLSKHAAMGDGASLSTAARSTATRSLRKKSSFLSLSSSSDSSILRPSTSSRSRSRGKMGDALRPLTSMSGPTRSTTHQRELSASTGRHSAFYSAIGDHSHAEQPRYSSATVSSPYFAPYFPLQSVRPDAADMTIPSIEEDAGSMYGPEDFDLEDIDPEILRDDHIYTSIVVEFPGGITGSFNPSAVRHATSLLTAIQPSNPQDILDGLQMSSVTDIVDLKKLVKAKGEIKDFLVRLPSANICFCNSSPLDSAEPPHEEQDQYDVVLSRVAFVTRETVTWDDPFKPASHHSRRSLHARLGSAEVSVSERLTHANETQAAVMAQIQDARISVGSRDVTYIDADIGAVRGSTAAGKIEYLASLIHRTNVAAAEFGALLSETMTRQEDRLRFFVHSLAARSQDTGDPLFFIRPSAVLRSAPEHLRTFDSWKLVLRLRQIWSTMGQEAKEELSLACLGLRPKAPENALEQVIASFRRWRSWDLGNLPDSLLVRKVFGAPEKSNIPPVEGTMPLLAICQVREIEFVLDPGPKENKLRIADISARLERNDKRHVSSECVADVKGPMTVLNVLCQDAGLQINWELCELANDVLRLYNKGQKEATVPTKLLEPDESPSASTQLSESFHILLAIDRGSVEVDTINLSGKSLAHGLKASLLMHGTESGGAGINFVFDCDGITSRLHSHSQVLGMFQLRSPSVFAAHELQQTDDMSYHTLKSTASSGGLTLLVKQDPIALLEVVDLLVRDEAAQLYRLKEQIPSSAPKPRKRSKKSKKITERLSAYRVNVGMFLDEYDISLPLLQSLKYNISGVVARAAMAANFGKEVIFDFDVKENAHEIQISVNNEPKSISLLRIPPTNGRITSLTSPTKNSVSVFSSVELVELDASAVYSLLSAINRPEISGALNEMQEQVKMIQAHVDDIFDTGVSVDGESVTMAKSSLVYSIHLTFAGLKIIGKTKLESEVEPTAHLLFLLESVHFGMSNQLEENGPLLDHPEVHVNLRQIAFDLKKGGGGNLRTCGSLAFGALLSATTRTGQDGKDERTFSFNSNGLGVDLSPDTVSTLVDVVGYLGEKIKDLDTSREIEYLRKLRQSRPKIAINDEEEIEAEDIIDSFLSTIVYQFEVKDIRVCWVVADMLDAAHEQEGKEDLVLSIKLIEFGTRKTKSARLTIRDLQLEMVPPDFDKNNRSHHSALLPEVIFNVAYVSTPSTRLMAFQAVGKSLDLRLTSGFILPAANLNDSIGLSVRKAQQAALQWNTSKGISTATSKPNEEEPNRSIFGTKRLESLLVDADFAGAVVHLSAKKDPIRIMSRRGRGTGGKYGQFTDDTGGSTVLRTPGLALKLEYRDPGREDPTLYGEIKVEGSSNILYPSVVPLIMDITSNIKEVVSDDQDKDSLPTEDNVMSPKPSDEDKILSADPTVVLGRLRLNLGLRICKQEFSLSCQPIARVAATACFEDIYVTVNTVRSKETGNFFAISAAFTNMQASVQHVYSRESTGNFELDSMVLSLMNSKHVSGTSGVSAILKLSPMKVGINAKQLQDFLLFREIWYPSDMSRPSAGAPVAKLQTETTAQSHLVQRYQQVAATAAFPWTATISISALEINVDLGQAIGKSVFAINDFWISSKKTSDWEQYLCLGFQRIGVDCTGRLSGFVALQDFRLRTSIQWPEREQALNETPLIQASIGFSQFRLKAAFDYQAFLVADITSLEFLMYNVRRSMEGSGDRLVAIFDGQAVQVFGTTSSAAQGIALWQTVQKLVQERRANFETSLREIEKFMRRKSSSLVTPSQQSVAATPKLPEDDTLAKSPISLDTDVVVTLKALNLGVFPSTFSDHQIFKMEALDAQARFAATMEHRRVRSILDLTLGQLRIGLAGVRNIEAPLTLSEISVEDVVERATGSRGGTILKVPRVHAAMETWQSPKHNRIDYIFKSAFEGKVEVGWNYSRISYIRGMWANHSKTLAQIWGREFAPMTAIKVTGVPEAGTTTAIEPGHGGDENKENKQQQQQKITAEVKVPQSKYEYVALEEPIIETPRLRDMGEATPPLEWIGLHRDRLPNLTHQIVIVTLLELAGEVEDAYSRILGSS